METQTSFIDSLVYLITTPGILHMVIFVMIVRNAGDWFSNLGDRVVGVSKRQMELDTFLMMRDAGLDPDDMAEVFDTHPAENPFYLDDEDYYGDVLDMLHANGIDPEDWADVLMTRGVSQAAYELGLERFPEALDTWEDLDDISDLEELLTDDLKQLRDLMEDDFQEGVFNDELEELLSFWDENPPEY